MSERGVGNPWTTYEDNLLIQAVAIHGENDNWKAVALSVPGRTNKACRKRWLHSLSPNVKKTAWTSEEDQLLLSLYAVHGTKWSVIARNIQGRTDDACSKRYREALDPSLKRDDWTAAEDTKLLEAYARLGGKWGIIGQELGRSGLGCRNRWRMLERKRTAAARGSAAEGAPSSSALDSTSQWVPDQGSVQDTPPWDGRSPQYVTPSMLFNSSPNHSQEPHSAAYRPEQILSGVHLASANNSPSHLQQFHYGSSSLGGVPPHPRSVAHSPNPYAYHPQTTSVSLGHDAPRGSRANVSTPGQSGESPCGDYEPITIPGSTICATPEATHQDDHQNTRSISNRQHVRPSLSPDLLGDAGPAVAISDSPASPSPVASPLPLDALPATPSTEHTGLSSAAVPSHSTQAPRCNYYRTEAEKAQLTTAPRKASASQRPTRLSSLLPATADPSVLAYACGHRDCWPEGGVSSKSAFTTSKELSDHNKIVHSGDLGGSKPFRCALAGCEKSWKSVNGLQYHLQISKVHFQQALATIRDPPVLGSAAAEFAASMASAQGTAEGEPVNGPPNTTADVIGSVGVPDEAVGDPGPDDARPTKPKRKLHPCPHPGCGKQYKQLSGLRYHLSHGHAEELPMQLDVVPPTLARMVAEKGRASHE
ncbi:hypothetical protein VTO73DRAFT_903 [Trametes versicolor]